MVTDSDYGLATWTIVDLSKADQLVAVRLTDYDFPPRVAFYL